MSFIFVSSHFSFFYSVQQVLTINRHVLLKNTYINLNKKMEDYLPKINVNVKNTNDF